MSQDPYDGEINPPWDIGKPQPRIIQAYQEGLIEGTVLDIGCGTGENALYMAEQGLTVYGVDMAPTGIAKASRKAVKRELENKVTFFEGSAYNLEPLDIQVDTVTDSGFLHGRSFEDKKKTVQSVERVLNQGGRYVILGFHENEETGQGPPNRLHREDFDEIFDEKWEVEQIEESGFYSNLPKSPHKAYFVVAKLND